MLMKRILLLGDPMQDVNINCEVRGVCQEFPGVILDVTDKQELPGGALNVKANLEAMGLKVTFIPTSTTSIKTRVWSDGHLMCRYDLDGRPVGLWEAQLEERLKDYDALVVSDYQKGMAEIAFAKMAQFCKYPTFVDTKAEQPHRYYLGVDFIFPNAKEWGTWPIEYRLDKLFKHVIHKVGENGCFVDGEHIPTVPIHGADTVGVGDTFLAAFVMEYLSHEGQVGKDGLVRCAKVANKAAGIACSKKGTAVVSLEEFL